MRPHLKRQACSVIIAAITIIAGCQKDATTTPSSGSGSPGGGGSPDNYSSTGSFFAKNGVPVQTFTVTNSAGGTFTTPQGTVVTIPANTFLNKNFQQVSGQVTISFKDIYKKSDMLLSNMPTNMFNQAPLKSGGEFFIKATAAGSAVLLANTITIKQPLNAPLDSAMGPFVKPNDTVGWIRNDSAGYCQPTLAGYVFDLYQFNSPVDSGSWCNSDNPTYFSAYPQTVLTLQESDDPKTYDTYVFLVFKNLNSMVHVYNGNGFTFPYNYAPVGLQCTVVAVGVKGGAVYSSFTPITIGTNQTVTFSMTKSTTAEFKSALAVLN